MELLSPKKIKRPDFSVIAGVTSPFVYTHPVLGVETTKSLYVISMNTEKENHIQFPSRPSAEQIETFGAMQLLMKSCVEDGEDVKSQLHQIMMSKEPPQSEEERVEKMKMDFMALKQWFMDDVRKSKIYKEFSKYNSTSKLKDFSRAFNTFILDRNKYTHGQLGLLAPNYRYVLEYIETPGHRTEYAFIDTEILKSYNSCYKEIAQLIREYNVARQKKQTMA